VAELLTDVEIVRGGAELLDTLRPLWLALRNHHGQVAPARGPVRDDDSSWGRRRGDYETWIADGAFILLARDAGDGRALAYAFVRPTELQASTWQDGRVLDVETLSVGPQARGRGVGAALLARVRAIHDAEGYGGVHLTAIAENADALRFYEREGFAPISITLQDTTRTP
jgi:GNAT superfamily N-acetyltransferase